MPVPVTSYNPSIPQSTDLLSNSQLSLLNNFGAIQTLVDVDHVDFANVAGGQHNKVTFFNQVGGLPVFSPLGVVGMYSAADATSGQNELYINKTNASGIVQVAVTESILGTTAAPTGFTSQGWTMLPSGIKLSWGVVTGLGNSTTSVSLSLQYAMPTTILSVFLSPISSDLTGTRPVACQRTTIGGPNTFNLNIMRWSTTSGAWVYSTDQVYYLAIGY